MENGEYVSINESIAFDHNLSFVIHLINIHTVQYIQQLPQYYEVLGGKKLFDVYSPKSKMFHLRVNHNCKKHDIVSLLGK